MKRLFVILICILTFVSSPGTKANELDNDMNIEKSILNKIKNFGINILDTKFAELEPIELASFDDFSKKDFDSKKEITYWSTMWHDNLDKLDIITKSSSTLRGYPVTNLFDKRHETAWVPGAKGTKGNGIGEWVSINLYPKKPDCPSGFEYFSMVPGYLKSDKTWEENNRVKSVLLVYKSADYQDSILRLKFKDYKGFQTFDIGHYIDLDFEAKFWVIIEDIYKGTKYDDTCISEIVINGIYSPSACDGPE